jgi:hypothetical protein
MRTLCPCALALLLSTLPAPVLGANVGTEKLKGCATNQKYACASMPGKLNSAPSAATSRQCAKIWAAQWGELKETGQASGRTYQPYSASCLKTVTVRHRNRLKQFFAALGS